MSKRITWSIYETLEKYQLINGKVHWRTKYDQRPIEVYRIPDSYTICEYLGRTVIAEHRLIWMLHYGYVPNIVDHINGIKDDNRIENLRDVTQRENGQNLPCHRKGKLPGAKKSGKYWNASLSIKGARVSLGSYATEKDAHLAYIAACNNLYLFHGDPMCFRRELIRRKLCALPLREPLPVSQKTKNVGKYRKEALLNI